MTRPVHRISAEKIKQSVDARIVELRRLQMSAQEAAARVRVDYEALTPEARLKRWPKYPPWTPEEAASFYDKQVEFEQEHYAKVRIVRVRPGAYGLVYGDVDEQRVGDGVGNMTGPFPTLRRAREWFLSGGR